MQDKPLQIEKIANGTDVVLRIRGPLLLGNFFPLQAEVRSDSSALLIIDTCHTSIPRGSVALVGSHVSREHSGRKLVIAGANERLLTSLKVTKVDQLFTFAPTVEQARAQASGA